MGKAFDEIRAQLSDMKVVVEDGASGSKWRIERQFFIVKLVCSPIDGNSKTRVLCRPPKTEGPLKCRGIAQSGSALALGARCREFKSLYPDQFLALSFYGDCSSVGRAPDCDSGCRGFEPHQSPQLITLHSIAYNQVLEFLNNVGNWL